MHACWRLESERGVHRAEGTIAWVQLVRFRITSYDTQFENVLS